MDGLSAAASGMAVVSLGMQVVQSVSKLYEFWKSMKDAPEDIRNIVRELGYLATILDGIHVDEQRYSDVMVQCIEKIHNLESIVATLEPEFAAPTRRVRYWAAFTAARKKGKIQEFQVSLEDTKSTLMLGLQVKQLSMSQSLEVVHTNLGGSMKSIDQQITEVNQQLQESRFHQARLSQDMERITKGIYELTTGQASRSISTIGLEAGLTVRHRLDVEAEIERMVSTSMNKLLQRGLQETMASAFQAVQSGPNDRVQPQSDHQKLQPDNLRTNIDVARIPEQGSELLQHLSTNFGLPENSNSPRRRKPAWTTVRRHSSYATTFFGKVTWYTKASTATVPGSSSTRIMADTDGAQLFKYETSFRYYPAPWMLRCGVASAFVLMHSKSIQGWTCKLEACRVVKKGAPIFMACKSGDIEAVRLLLDHGQASVYDVDEWGVSPLFGAATYSRPDVCKLLVKAGANPDEMINKRFWLDHPIYRLFEDFEPGTMSRMCETIRLFLEDFDLDVSVEDYFEVLRWSVDLQGTLRYDTTYLTEDSLQAHQIFVYLQNIHRSKMCVNDDRSEYVMDVIDLLVESVGLALFEQFRLLWSKIDVSCDVFVGWGSCSFVHLIVGTNRGDFATAETSDTFNQIQTTQGSIDILNFLASLGADLHLLGIDQEYSERAETPTSLALRSAISFSTWQQFLRVSGVNLREFVGAELQIASPLIDDGWNFESLVAVLELDFEPWGELCHSWCSRCGTPRTPTQQRSWMAKMEELKQGQLLSKEVLNDPNYGIPPRPRHWKDERERNEWYLQHTWIDGGRPCYRCPRRRGEADEIETESLETESEPVNVPPMPGAYVA